MDQKDNALMTMESGVIDSGFGAIEEIAQQAEEAVKKIPFVTWLQPTTSLVTSSKGKLAAGNFYLPPEEGETEPAMYTDKLENICIIAVDLNRTMWDKSGGGYQKNRKKPDCQSYDGITKVDDGCGPEKCDGCEYAKYNKDRRKSLCTQSYVFTCVNLTTGQKFKVGFDGMRFSRARSFIGTDLHKAWKDIQEDWRNGKNKELAGSILANPQQPTIPYCLSFDLETEYQENDQGVFYVGKFSNIRPNSDIFGVDDFSVISAKFMEFKTANEYVRRFQTQQDNNPDSLDIVPDETDGELPF